MPWRFYFVMAIIFLTVIGLFGRALFLTIVDKNFLQKQGDARVVRLIETPAFRGVIEDRNGFPLAVSASVFSVWMNPQTFPTHSPHIQELGKLLQIPVATIVKQAEVLKKRQREFYYLKRGISPQLANRIKSLNIPGIYMKEGYKRFYPEGEITSHIIGFTNVDDEGQEGIELGYNHWLRGAAGKKLMVKDRLDRYIDDIQDIMPQTPGKNLTLSIDRHLQYLAYRELYKGIIKNKARSGSVVILDVQTGEILAMANYPSYNPNNRHGHLNAALRNRAITDTFEPGSTMKAFTVASGLETGKVNTLSAIDTAPGYLRLDRNLVRDERNNGTLTLSQILQVSSNVGAAKIALALPADALWSLLHRVGLGEITGIGFPGEQSGRLIKHDPWGAFTLASLSYGYGLTVTPLQLARAYAIIANEGMKLPLSLLKIKDVPRGQRVISPQITKQLLSLLETVMHKGSGKKSQVPGYRVAGKSGTAKLVGKQGYEKHRYISSFVGVAPVSRPRIVVAVVINDPKGKEYYGGRVSGPVFKNVMEQSLRRLSIAPDDAESLAS